MDTFVPDHYFRINEFSGLLNRPLVEISSQTFFRTSEISGLSEPKLTNHHGICMGTHSQPLLQNRLMDIYETWQG